MEVSYPIALDLETTGLSFNDRILSIGAAWSDGQQNYKKSWLVGTQDLYHSRDSHPTIVQELRSLVLQSNLVIFHNTTFDLSYLLGNGYLLESDVQGKLFDTLLTSRMTAARESVSLHNLCLQYNITDEKWVKQKEKRASLENAGVDILLSYNETDALHTLLLGLILWEEAKAIYDPAFVLHESDFCRVMAKVRVRGKALNRHATEVYLAEQEMRRKQLMKDLLWPNQIESANDRTGIIKFLKAHGMNSLPGTQKGNDSVSKDSLEELQLGLHGSLSTICASVVEAVLESRKIEKMVGTYLIPMLTEHADALDRIHPNYTVGGAMTYRLTSSNPNGQNMPKDLPIWEPYLSCDYKQAEPRLTAMYSQEPTLVKAFFTGADIYKEIAVKLWGESTREDPKKRQMGKQIQLAATYGGGANSLSRATSITFDQAMDFIRTYRKVMPRIHQTTSKARQQWETVGYLKLWTGKRIYATEEDKKRGYKGFNNLIQGGVGELVKEAMIKLDAQGFPMIEQIHDEVGLEPYVDKEAVRDIMTSILPDWLTSRTKPTISTQVDIELKGIKG